MVYIVLQSFSRKLFVRIVMLVDHIMGNQFIDNILILNFLIKMVLNIDILNKFILKVVFSSNLMFIHSSQLIDKLVLKIDFLQNSVKKLLFSKLIGHVPVIRNKLLSSHVLLYLESLIKDILNSVIDFNFDVFFCADSGVCNLIFLC